MSNKQRWDKEEELKLINSISSGETLENIAIKHNRSTSAIELRLKKIIYENCISGKSLESIAKLLNMTVDKIRQYFYSYKEFREKHTGVVDDVIIPSDKNKQNIDNKLDKISSTFKKLETENKILRLIVENKELTHKLNKLIKDGKVDKSIKTILKILRNKNN